MGEVGTNSSDNPHVGLKMNGGINGNCEDEPMDVDSQDDSQASSEISTKKSEIESNTSNSTDGSALKNKTESKLDALPKEEISSQVANELSVKNKTKENGNSEKLDSSNGNDENTDNTDNVNTTTVVSKFIANKSDESEINLDNSTDSTSDKCEDIEMVENTKVINEKFEKDSTSDSKLTAVIAGTEKTVNGGIIEDDDVQHIPDVQEVHDISDSDDDEPKQKNIESPLKAGDDVMEVDGKRSNGVNNIKENDDDKPVSIHSDSDTENEHSNKNEVHEILSDKEDCVVIEDDKKIDGDISIRRTNRARKSAVRPRDFSEYDDDIEEVIEDPLQQLSIKKPRMNLPQTLSIQDARSIASDPLTGSEFSHQFNQSNNNKSKEPTLVIIDTNTILSRGTSSTVQALQKQNVSVMPVGVPAQGLYPINMRASITPVPNTGTNKNALNAIVSPLTADLTSSLMNAPLLTALTDDMFVLEAPSFIVPYIYEKPPANDLREIVDKMSIELEERRKTESKDENVIDIKSEAKEDQENETDADKAKKDTKKKRKPVKNADDSWDESDTSTDDEASDVEERTKVLIKEAKEDLDAIKTHIINRDGTKDLLNSDEKKDSNNYFESPLGKFFMDIGINLVQEHVQTDLLRQQKRKLNREGNQASPSVQVAINSLMKNLELSKAKNDVFKFETKRCEYCNFKSESSLVMAHHYETPHMKGNQYKCNFCSYEVRPPYDILFHMKNVHNIQARLEKAASYHQCPNCLFEDNGRSKLARHALVCSKKFRPEINLCPPVDWEPPAKIPRIKPRHGLVGTANAYQAMAAQAQRAATAAALQRQNAANAAALMRNRGRPQTITKTSTPIINNVRPNQQNIRPQMAGGIVLPNNFQLTNAGQYIQVSGSGMALLPNIQNSFNLIQPTGSKTNKNSQQPSISITALPRQHQSMHSTASNISTNALQQAAAILPKPPGIGNMKPGQSPQGGGKASFVICEICDGYIKDLDQLRNHMQWMHKVKIHPKMIYNRPPLNCQKCQFRFFTDQGLERHLLGSHGLVTSSMQEAANKGKDAGRCPVCGRMYQWKLLNHVSREHNMTLKPAHLSYKCTVCTATFGMYKQFENHVYSAHSTVAKKSMDGKKLNSSSGSGISSKNIGGSALTVTSSNAGDSLLKPLKINDEITIIPQPASRNNRPIEIESHVID